MTITQVRWSDHGARDVHLLPGMASPQLNQLLWLFDDDLDDWFRADKPPDGITFNLEFRAAFTFAPSSHGVHVNGQSGLVTVDAQLPTLPPHLRTFIISARASQGVPDPDPGFPDPLTARIRIYVHNALANQWLTPSSLTVRQSAKFMRFSVLGRFDDGVIGDITNWSPLYPPKQDELMFVHRVGSTDPMFIWSPRRGDPSTSMYVDPVTGEIGCEDPTASMKISVQYNLGNPLASAMAIGAPPWSAAVNLSRVAGPGFDRMYDEDIHNVLFLPDGFVDDDHNVDREAFNTYVRALVTQLTTNSQTRPFDVLASKFNYFSAWVPSPEAGISGLAEQYAGEPDVDAYQGLMLEYPEPPTGTPASLSLPELIDTVGPPTPVFDPIGSPPGTDAAGRVHEWQQLYGDLPTAARTAAAYSDWLDRSTRVLVNERNTAFHCADSWRPRIDQAGLNPVNLQFHPLRLTDDDFDVFLQALRDDQGHQQVDEDGDPVAPPWAIGEKDSSLIVIVCRMGRTGGTNTPRGGGKYICISMDDGDFLNYVANPDGNGYDLVPDEVPFDASLGAWGTVAHEIAHSFLIDDEYGGRGELPASEVDDVKASNNTQERAALVNGQDELIADAIKWRWPRLRQAGILQDPSDTVDAIRPDPATPGQFILSLAFEHGFNFADPAVDIVCLRKRRLHGNPKLSVRFHLLDVTLDDLTVRPIAGAQFDPDDFSSGDLVVAPRRAPDPNAAADQFGDDLEMVSAVVVGRINDTNNPLNAKPDDDHNRDCSGTVAWPTPATNFAPGTRPKTPRLSYQLVGLYENAHGYNCDAYHSTGLCMMYYRVYSAGTPARRRLSGFCPVCRYAMVDLIDPSAHGAIDADYDRIYPT